MNSYSQLPAGNLIRDEGFHTKHQIAATQKAGTRAKLLTVFAALCVIAPTAIALGVGLGVPLSQCRAQTNPDNYSVLSANQVTLLRHDNYCNSNGQLTRNRVYDIGRDNASFDLFCGMDFPAGVYAYDAKSTAGKLNGTIYNIAIITTYTVDDCIRACYSLNELAIDKDVESPTCQSISFTADLQNAVKDYRGNCFLKNATIFALSEAVMGEGTAVSAEIHELRKRK